MAKATKKSIKKSQIDITDWDKKGKTARASMKGPRGRIVVFDFEKRLIPKPCRGAGSSFQCVVTTYTDKRGHVHQNTVYRPHPGVDDAAHLRRLFPDILR